MNSDYDINNYLDFNNSDFVEDYEYQQVSQLNTEDIIQQIAKQEAQEISQQSTAENTNEITKQKEKQNTMQNTKEVAQQSAQQKSNQTTQQRTQKQIQQNNQPNSYNNELITLNEAIEILRKSATGEKEDELFYDTIIQQAPSEKEKNIIRSIRDDERKHNKIIRDLYYNFTGDTIQEDTSITTENNQLSYKENLEKALFGELDAVVKYRKILSKMPSGDSYTLLMLIMTDELRHASKYNYLIHNAK